MGLLTKLANVVYSSDELKKDAEAEAAAALETAAEEHVAAATNGVGGATATAAPSEVTLQV